MTGTPAQVPPEPNLPPVAEKSRPAPQSSTSVVQQLPPAPSPQVSENPVLAQTRRLAWQRGPSQGRIAFNASIHIPSNYSFLSATETVKFLSLMQNLPIENGYLYAPNDLSWFALFEFSPVGYVRDDESIDPNVIFEALKRVNVRSNEERRKLGLPVLELEGWFTPPHYDIQTRRLEWATKLRNVDGDISVNYNIRLLGRSGVMNAVLVSEPETLASDVRAFKSTLASFSFDAGERYMEFRAGDKVAEYGLTGLIVGGAVAVAAKSGLLNILGKFGLLIIAGIGAVIAGFFNMLRRLGRPAT
jgi:uncharacterized membrane-anchored protein